ncbi:MAG: DUF1175 family protein [Bryobacteraceae bacterium]|nr:DUF1175 family protein [Bryobacteraceae bacterium]
MTRLSVVSCLLLTACGGGGPKLTLQLSQSTLPADGFSFATINTNRPDARLAVVEGPHSAHLDGPRLVAGIVPGKAILEATVPNQRPVRATIETKPVWTDRFGDGTPDFLRLNDPLDVAAFVDNFTAIALAVEAAPAGITDCSAFVRHCYREALRGYEGRTVTKYQFPFTPLGPKIFRTPSDYAEFADAETLARFNTHPISRDVRRATKGDLLFFRQSDQKSPWHVMIVCDKDRVCYHTGPDGEWKGEIRRPTVDELQRHELPKWRPFPGNSNFLGVYRWNILRQDI